MIEPFEKLDAVARGFKLSDLVAYEGLRGFALVRDPKTRLQKIYSYSYAKFLEDRDLVEIIATGLTIGELTNNVEKRRVKPSASDSSAEKIIKAFEKAENLLRARRSGRRFKEVERRIDARIFNQQG